MIFETNCSAASVVAKRLTAGVGLLLVSLSSIAKRLSAPQGITTIQLSSCQTVRFEASPARSPRAEGTAYLLDAPGASYTGTLISGGVGEWQWVWEYPPPHPEVDPPTWRPQKHAFFVLDGAAETICPAVLPASLTVITAGECCDVFPNSGVCIVPHLRVRILRDRNALFPYRRRQPSP